MKKELGLAEAMDAAYTYLTHRERTSREVEVRLKDKGFSEGVITECLEELLSFGYVDDAQYARDYLRWGLSRSRGYLRLSRELEQKGLSRDMIREAVYALEDETGRDFGEQEREAAFRLAEKTLGEAELDKKTEGRVYRKLAAAGFASDIIYGTLRRLREEV